MARNAPWTEGEARATVQEYSGLVRAEQEGRSVNKRDVYRKLSAPYPARPCKAFELKFQNISAILYENRLRPITAIAMPSNALLDGISSMSDGSVRG